MWIELSIALDHFSAMPKLFLLDVPVHVDIFFKTWQKLIQKNNLGIGPKYEIVSKQAKYELRGLGGRSKQGWDLFIQFLGFLRLLT